MSRKGQKGNEKHNATCSYFESATCRRVTSFCVNWTPSFAVFTIIISNVLHFFINNTADCNGRCYKRFNMKILSQISVIL